jgi:hypothetical protein
MGISSGGQTRFPVLWSRDERFWRGSHSSIVLVVVLVLVFYRWTRYEATPLGAYKCE